jgi:hypothetical protein
VAYRLVVGYERRRRSLRGGAASGTGRDDRGVQR